MEYEIGRIISTPTTNIHNTRNKRGNDKMIELPRRKQIRLKEFDYSQNGYYFVTVCTKSRQPLFWSDVGADSIRPCLSEYGKIADTAINAIPQHYSNIIIDEYVIMPDHIHLIIKILNDENDGRIISAPTRSIMTIIGQMKRWVSKNVGFSIWQKSYYEHIIRDENDYNEKAQYIINNPMKYQLKDNQI